MDWTAGYFGARTSRTCVVTRAVVRLDKYVLNIGIEIEIDCLCLLLKLPLPRIRPRPLGHLDYKST